MRKIIIRVGELNLEAELNEKPTAGKVWEALPIEGRANRWGDEIYLEIPVAAEPEPDAREEMEVGELGYWPVGRAFCIFFGPTPASHGEQPRAYSPVNLLGRVSGDATLFRQIKSGESVVIERAD